MRMTHHRSSRHFVEVTGDPLQCLSATAESKSSASVPPSVRVIGIDGTSAHTRAGLAALLRRHKRNTSTVPGSVSHVIVVIDHPHCTDAWTTSKVHRWAMSIHRRIQRARGIDTDVTALLVNRDVAPHLICERIEELAGRPPGVNPAAVHTMHDIRAHTIAQASANDFI